MELSPPPISSLLLALVSGIGVHFLQILGLTLALVLLLYIELDRGEFTALCPLPGHPLMNPGSYFCPASPLFDFVKVGTPRVPE